jgi:LmbE family N-acetylglucosaminyl deacetylase
VFLEGADGNLAEPAVLSELAAKVAQEVARRGPKVIYVPHAQDKHPDHSAACRMVLQVVRDGPTPQPVVYQYELWSPLTADFAVDVTREMKVKLKAIKCHALALDAFDYLPTMLGLAAYRSGTLLQRRGYAEAFKRSAS